MRRTGNNRNIRTTQPVETDWRMVALVVVCGVALAAGFFFAARQHFLSMDIGFKNSKLRKQLEELENEKRRLLLAREVSLSPLELRKATKTVVMESEPLPDNKPAQYKATQTAVTAATLTLKPAATILTRKKPSTEERRAEPSEKDAPVPGKRNIELAAAINIR